MSRDRWSERSLCGLMRRSWGFTRSGPSEISRSSSGEWIQACLQVAASGIAQAASRLATSASRVPLDCHKSAFCIDWASLARLVSAASPFALFRAHRRPAEETSWPLFGQSLVDANPGAPAASYRGTGAQSPWYPRQGSPCRSHHTACRSWRQRGWHYSNTEALSDPWRPWPPRWGPFASGLPPWVFLLCRDRFDYVLLGTPDLFGGEWASFLSDTFVSWTSWHFSHLFRLSPAPTESFGYLTSDWFAMACLLPPQRPLPPRSCFSWLPTTRARSSWSQSAIWPSWCSCSALCNRFQKWRLEPSCDCMPTRSSDHLSSHHTVACNLVLALFWASAALWSSCSPHAPLHSFFSSFSRSSWCSCSASCLRCLICFWCFSWSQLETATVLAPNSSHLALCTAHAGSYRTRPSLSLWFLESILWIRASSKSTWMLFLSASGH